MEDYVQQRTIRNETFRTVNIVTITSVSRTRPCDDVLKRDFTIPQNRIDSFATWPVASKQSPVVMSENGFYYTQHGDSVQCFVCNATVSRWLDTDDPFTRHLGVNPTCEFITGMCVKSGIPEITTFTTNNSNENEPEHRDDDDDDDNDDEENIDYKDKCIMCTTSDWNVCCVPCGHLCVCVSCSYGLQHSCPVCRTKPVEFLRVYKN